MENIVATKATDEWNASTSSPTLTNHTTTTGTLKVILAAISYYTEASATVSAYSFDGVSGTRVSGTNQLVGTDRGTDFWVVKLGTHTGGSKAQSLTFSAASTTGTVTLYEVDGIDQTTPGLHGVVSTGAGSPSVSVLTVASGEISFDVFAAFDGALNGDPTGNGSTATHVEVLDKLTSGGIACYSGYNSTATGTVVMAWSNDTGTYSQSACSLAVAAAGGASAPMFRGS